MTACRTLTAVAMLACAGIAVARPADTYGPPPDWGRFKAVAEPAIRAKLPDPSTWTIAWPNGYMKGGWRHKGRFVGYMTCGILRATEPVPGYRAVTHFVAVVDNDQVQTIDISTRESNSLVNVICADLMSHGRLPPARLMEDVSDVTIAPLGLTVRAMEQGAYVTAVAPGSPAAAAGLATGIVLTRANGIALAGIGTAIAILRSDAEVLTLETATGGRIVVRRKSGSQ